jgi:ABC-2 type transport system ATP-binding protein
VNNENIGIFGIESIVILSDNIISFMYSGNINELTGFLAGRQINNLMIEEPSLDEIFLHYYKN